ncbi:MAG TPA: hypothetical protein VGK93_11530 [Candidatus Eisenbacteria bacterium]
MRFEHRHQPLLPAAQFRARMVAYGAVSGVLILGSLAIGILGYHVFAGLSWLDSLLNASMILTGMGPVDPMPTAAAKLFASVYALFSGVAFLTSVGVLLAPAAHRLLHRLHLEMDETSGPGARKSR